MNNTINKAGRRGPNVVTPRLLSSRVIWCHKEGLGKITIGSVQSSTARPSTPALLAVWGFRLGFCTALWDISWCKKGYINKFDLIWCTRGANINNVPLNLSWLKVEERLTLSLLVFVRDVNKLNSQKCLFKLLAHSLDTHAYPTRHATRGLFTIPKSRIDYGRRTVLHRALATWNSIPYQVTDASSRIRFRLNKYTLWNSGDCEVTQT